MGHGGLEIYRERADLKQILAYVDRSTRSPSPLVFGLTV